MVSYLSQCLCMAQHKTKN